MNTLLFSLLFSLASKPDTITSVQPSFAVSAYVIESTGQLRIAVDNLRKCQVYVRLVNRTNEILHEDVILPRQDDLYRRLFNLNQLPQGTYFLKVSDGRRTVVHDVTVGALVPVQPVRQVSLRTVAP